MPDAALTDRWVADARAGGADAGPAALRATGTDLLRRWAEPHRRYHDLTHLGAVLDALDRLPPDGGLPTVRLAAWFHDAVYAGRPGQDEQASADLAVAVLGGLGVPAGPVGEVRRMVLLTAAHDPVPGDAAGEALCDADLAILAADPADYARYAAAVRAEYAHVPEAAYRAGRAAVLRALQDRPRLYRTAVGRRWEPAARRNVAAELRRLDSKE